MHSGEQVAGGKGIRLDAQEQSRHEEHDRGPEEESQRSRDGRDHPAG